MLGNHVIILKIHQQKEKSSTDPALPIQFVPQDKQSWQREGSHERSISGNKQRKKELEYHHFYHSQWLNVSRK